MSTPFYDLASLVVVPSGYKSGKVYAQKPQTTDGQLAFTRASSATRVASSGLIEKVRTNLILQSEAFNTTWAPASVSVTPNTTANPLNGALTADTITLTGATAPKYITQTIIYGGSTTTSVYLKAGTHQFVQICLGTDPTPFANFDLVNGTASATGSTASIVSAGGGFFRCSMAATSIIGTDIIILAVDSLAATRFLSTASTGTFIAFGAQVETGDIATAYIATTTAAVSVGPVSGLPRLDYLGSTCPRLLLEPQRTNLVFFSEQLNNAGWAVDAVVTANTAVSPDGYTNADSVMESATTAFHILGDAVTTINGTTYSYSFFAKPNGRNFARILFGNDSFIDSQSAYFNLLTGAVSTSASVTASMVSYGNGWYRCTAICTSDASASSPIYFGPARNMTDGYATYAGNASLGIYAFGAQQEAGSYASSYIPTLGASVTRVADEAIKTSISSLIGQTEGTLFAEFDFVAGENSNYGIIYQAAFSTYIYINQQTTGSISGQVQGVGNFSFTQAKPNGRYKCAIAYKSGNSAFFINGVQVGTTNTTTFTPVAMDIFGLLSTETKKIYQSLLFKTRLTNAQLAEITAL